MRSLAFRSGLLAVAALVAGAGAVHPAAAAPPTVVGASQQAAPSPDQQTAPTQDFRDDEPSNAEFDELAASAGPDGRVRAIVGLKVEFTPEGDLAAPAIEQQRAEIDDEADALLREVRQNNGQLLRDFSTVPFVAVELPQRALEALRRSPHVASVTEDVADAPFLDVTTPLVQADLMTEAGYDGADQTIAVLDTGVESTHAYLGGRVVEEACYAQGNTTGDTMGDCPNGMRSQTGPGSGVACAYSAACFHGTHVTGIAAGAGVPNGVAPGAGIMAVQVFSELEASTCGTGALTSCARTYVSDQIAGLERVFALKDTYDFAAVNMSLGGGRYVDHCDTDARKPIIDNLLSAGIPTIVASGNSGYRSSVAAPACISTAVAVASTDNGGAISSFSNSDDILIDLLAPGYDVMSSTVGNTFVTASGTSMAAPQVAGAFAALRDFAPSAPVDALLSRLKETGVLTADTRTGTDAAGVTSDGHVHPRILINDAGPAYYDLAAPYLPVLPERLLDTRADGPQVGYIGAKPAAGQTVELQVTGAGATLVPADAAAVVLNVTGVAATTNGFVTVWPCGTSRPAPSNLNLVTGSARPNLVIAKIGTGGKVCMFTNGGAHLIADINGFYPAGTDYVGVVPERLLDTRPEAPGPIGYAGTKPTPGQTVELQVTGAGTTNIPSDAAAVVLNVTGTQASNNGFVTVWPCGTPRPTPSNLNLVASGTRPNLVIAKIGTGGKVCIFTSGGTHLIADINGYYPAGTTYVGVVPERLLETRADQPTPQTGYTGPKPTAGQTIELQITGAGTTNVPANAAAAVLNVTGIQAPANGFITVWPCGTRRPTPSNLNLVAGVNAPNLLLSKIGQNGKVCLFTQNGAHLVADINGYIPAVG